MTPRATWPRLRRVRRLHCAPPQPDALHSTPQHNNTSHQLPACITHILPSFASPRLVGRAAAPPLLLFAVHVVASVDSPPPLPRFAAKH